MYQNIFEDEIPNEGSSGQQNFYIPRTLSNRSHFYDPTNSEHRQAKYSAFMKQPLNTDRLQRGVETHTLFKQFAILHDGSVQFAMINTRKYMTEIFVVPVGGTQLIKNKSFGAVIGDFVPNYPPGWGKRDIKFRWNSLPPYLNKIYKRMVNFTFVVKSKVAKIIFYTNRTKFVASENGLDMFAEFYNGMKIETSYYGGLKITDANGMVHDNPLNYNQDVVDGLIHFKTCAMKISDVEKNTKDWSSDMFPIVIGRQRNN